MISSGFGLFLCAALSLSAFVGPAPRDLTTNKPTPEQCAAAARDARPLTGCAEDEGETDAAEPRQAGARERSMACPQDPRCPR